MALSVSLRVTVLILQLILNIGILLPLLIYSYYRFNKLCADSQLLIIQKRYPSIIKITVILCLLTLCIERNIGALLYSELVDNAFLARTDRIIYAIVQAVLVCGLWRVWMIFYDLKTSKVLTDSNWKKYLNASLFENNFYLANKSKYGSSNFVKKVIFISWLSTAIIRITLFQLWMFDKRFVIARFIDAFLYLVLVILIWMINFLSPSIEDKFYFKMEMYYYCLVLFIGIFFYVLFIIIQGTEIMDIYYPNILISIDGSIILWTLCMIQTQWITHKIKNNPSYNASFIGGGKYKMVKLIVNDAHKKKKQISLKEYISNQQGFEAFVKHLHQEFSLELILFIIEISQFKELIIKKEQIIALSVDEEEGIISSNIKIPKSQIVHQLFADEAMNEHSTVYLDDLSKLKSVACLLYDRYIYPGAELEINISYGHRNSLRAVLGNSETFMKNNS
eukprot:15479_1